MSEVNVEELEVRNLQTKDLFKVATILSKCGDKLMKAIRESNIDLGKLGEKAKELGEAEDEKKKKAKEIGKEDEKKEVKDGEEPEEEIDPDIQAFGVQLFSVVLSIAETEIKAFMADLVNMKVAEFDVLPYQAPLVIIEKLAKEEDLPAFFQRATKLVEIFKPSGKKQTV